MGAEGSDLGIRADFLPACAANTESFLVSFFEPQCGQATEPSQWIERASDSKSLSHLAQTNS
jgi:hypothetical protein